MLIKRLTTEPAGSRCPKRRREQEASEMKKGESAGSVKSLRRSRGGRGNLIQGLIVFR